MRTWFTVGVLSLLAILGLAGAAHGDEVEAGGACASVEESADCRYVAFSATGNADARYGAVSGTGDAHTCWKTFLIDFREPCGPAVSLTGHASGRLAWSASGRCEGDPDDGSEECQDVSATEDSYGHWAGASGTGDAACQGVVCVALAPSANATGAIPVSLLGRCRHNPHDDYEPCVDVAGTDDTEGHYASASGTGHSGSEWVAVSGTGNVGEGFLVATGTGDAPHSFNWIAVTGTGDAHGLAAVSLTGNTTGLWTVSGTGHSDGKAISVSGCDTVRYLGSDAACIFLEPSLDPSVLP